MIKKLRLFLIDEKDLVTTLAVMDEIELNANMKIGRTRWSKAPTAWFIRINATDKKWHEFLRLLKEKGVDLLPETTGY